MSDLIEVELYRMALEERGQRNLLFLRVRAGDERAFRISIGAFEAYEIRRKVCDEPVKRPMPHDLIGRILQATGFVLDRIVITRLENETFYAYLALTGEAGEALQVDCRPSDGIALAMQVGAPIFVTPEVLDAVGTESEA